MVFYGRQRTDKNLDPTAVYCFTLHCVDVIVLRREHRCNRLNVTKSTTYIRFPKYKVQVLSKKLMQYEYLTKKLTISWVVQVQSSGWVSITNKEIISQCTKFTMTQEYLTKQLSSKADVQVQSTRVDLNEIWVDKQKHCFCLERLLAF